MTNLKNQSLKIEKADEVDYGDDDDGGVCGGDGCG